MNKSFSIFLLLALSVGGGFAADAPAARKAPELAFTLPVDGAKLLSQYRGKVVAIEFIMTTCPHCQAAAKVMTRFQQEFGSRGFQALDLAINVQVPGTSMDSAKAQASLFATTYQAGFPVGFLPQEQMLSFMGFSILDRMVVPQLALIDRKGFIRYQTPAASGPDWDKQTNETTMRDHIAELVAEGGATSAHPAKAAHVASAKKSQ